MNFNELSLTQKLGILDDLLRTGPLQVGEKGKLLSSILKQLRNNFTWSDSMQIYIQTFTTKFRSLIQQHKAYIFDRNQLQQLQMPIDEQISFFNDKFTNLQFQMNTLVDEVSSFILKCGLQIQEGQVIFVPEEQQAAAEEQQAAAEEQQAAAEEQQAAAEKAITEEQETVTKQPESVLIDTNIITNSPIFQIGISLPINKLVNFTSFSKTNMSVSIEPELQFNYSKTLNGKKIFFIGINCDLNLNLSNFKKFQTKKSNLVNVKCFNTVGRLGYSSNENTGYLTLSVGQNFKLQNKKCQFFLNFPLKKQNSNFLFKNSSFQFNYNECKTFIVSEPQFSYLRVQTNLSYEIFPFNFQSHANSKNFKKYFENKSGKPPVSSDNTVETGDFSDKLFRAGAETADIVLERYDTPFRDHATMCAAVSSEPNTSFPDYKSPLLVVCPGIGLAIFLLGLSFAFFWNRKNTK